MLTFAPPVNLFWILADVLQVLLVLIFVEVIVSWLPMFGVRSVGPHTRWVRLLRAVTGPVLAPFRRLQDWILDRGQRQFGWRTWAARRIDLSPVLAFLIIQLAQGILLQAGR